MSPDPPSPASRQSPAGHRGDVDALVTLLYDELRRLAHARLGGERPGHTLSTTGLVHEAYLRLAHMDGVAWQGRGHFMAVAATVMRRILVDFARSRRRAKRGGGLLALSLDAAAGVGAERNEDLLALEEALVRLESRNERQCRVVECRCFAGLSLEETAAALNTSVATVKRDWAFSRAWLNRELTGDSRERDARSSA